MIRKSGKFLADWRDEKGRRHRKAFTTARAARSFSNAKRNETASKKARASAR